MHVLLSTMRYASLKEPRCGHSLPAYSTLLCGTSVIMARGCGVTSDGAKSRPSLALCQSMMRPTKGLINAAPASAHAAACAEAPKGPG